MKKIFFLSILLCCFFSTKSFSQDYIDNIAPIYQQDANHILKKYFYDNLGKSKILLFSMSSFSGPTFGYLVIVEKNNQYENFYINERCENLKKVSIKRYPEKNKQKLREKEEYEKSILQKAFNNTNYHEEYIILNSNFSKTHIGGGAPVYFVFINEDGVHQGEFCSGFLVSPYPIEQKLEHYLVNTLIEQEYLQSCIEIKE